MSSEWRQPGRVVRTRERRRGSGRGRARSSRSLVSLPVDHRSRMFDFSSRERCASASAMDESSPPRERPAHRPPAPPAAAAPAPATFDNLGYQPDDPVRQNDANHNVTAEESFGANGTSNGGAKEPNDAVNLELINLAPKNGHAPKKDVEVDLSTANPYDEYFVPVNEHKKYIRGEKLYVTADKREKGGCRGRLCWALGAALLLAAILVAVLAATGVISTGAATPVDQYNSSISSARALGGVAAAFDHSHDHRDHGHDHHDHAQNETGRHESDESREDGGSESASGEGDSAGRKLEHDDQDDSVYVPRTLEGELRIDNEQLSDALADDSSAVYREFTSTLAQALARAVLRGAPGDDDVRVEIVNLRPGSVIVTYRIHWTPKNQNSPDPIYTETLKSRLSNYLDHNNRMLNVYHVAEDELVAKRVLNVCQDNNNGCEYGCEFDTVALDFRCTCPSGKVPDMNNPKKCVRLMENSLYQPTTTAKPRVQSKGAVSRQQPYDEANMFDWMNTEAPKAEHATVKTLNIDSSHVFGRPSDELLVEPIDTSADSSQQSIPSGEPTGEPTPEPKSEPTATPQLETNVFTKEVITPKSEPEPTSEPGSSSEPNSKSEQVAEQQSESNTYADLSSENEASAEPEPESEPEPTSEPKTESDITFEQTPETKLPKPEHELSTESTSEPEPASEPKSEHELNVVPKSEPEPIEQSNKSKSGSEPFEILGHDPILEPKSGPEPTAEPKSEPEPTAEPKSGQEPSTDPSTDPRSEPESTAEPMARPEPIAEPTSEPETTAEPTAEPRSDQDSQTTIPADYLNKESKSAPQAKHEQYKPDRTVESESSGEQEPDSLPTLKFATEPENTESSKEITDQKVISLAESIFQRKPQPEYIMKNSTSSKEIISNNSSEIHSISVGINGVNDYDQIFFDNIAPTKSKSNASISEESQNTEMNEPIDLADIMESSSENSPEISTSTISMQDEKDTELGKEIPKEIKFIMAREDSDEIDKNSKFEDNLNVSTPSNNNNNQTKYTTDPNDSIHAFTILEDSTTKDSPSQRWEDGRDLKYTKNKAIASLDNKSNIPQLELETNNQSMSNNSKPSKLNEEYEESNSDKQDNSTFIEESQSKPENSDETSEEISAVTMSINLFKQSEEHRTSYEITKEAAPKSDNNLKNIPNDEYPDLLSTIIDLNSKSSASNESNISKLENTLKEKIEDSKADWLSSDTAQKDKPMNASTNFTSSDIRDLSKSDHNEENMDSDYLSNSGTETSQDVPQYGVLTDYDTASNINKRVGEYPKQSESITEKNILKSTVIADYVLNAKIRSEKETENSNNAERGIYSNENSSKEPAPVWEQDEIEPEQVFYNHIDAGDSTTDAPAILVESTITSLQIPLKDVLNISEPSKLNGTIHKKYDNVTISDVRSADSEEHLDMNPYLPEINNNKSLVKKLHEGQDLEPSNINDTQNEHTDEPSLGEILNKEREIENKDVLSKTESIIKDDADNNRIMATKLFETQGVETSNLNTDKLYTNGTFLAETNSKNNKMERNIADEKSLLSENGVPSTTELIDNNQDSDEKNVEKLIEDYVLDGNAYTNITVNKLIVDPLSEESESKQTNVDSKLIAIKQPLPSEEDFRVTTELYNDEENEKTEGLLITMHEKNSEKEDTPESKIQQHVASSATNDQNYDPTKKHVNEIITSTFSSDTSDLISSKDSRTGNPTMVQSELNDKIINTSSENRSPEEFQTTTQQGSVFSSNALEEINVKTDPATTEHFSESSSELTPKDELSVIPIKSTKKIDKKAPHDFLQKKNDKNSKLQENNLNNISDDSDIRTLDYSNNYATPNISEQK